jgi:tetratricopeptide (TPR) repeat protein
MRNFNKMIETAKQYLAISGSPESYQLLSYAYSQLGQMEEALRTSQQVLDLFPDHSGVIKSIADLFTYMGLYSMAEKTFLKLIQKNQSPIIKQNGYDRLAEFYPYQGKYRKALYYADKGIELSWQSSDTVRALISYNRKATLLLLGWNDPESAWTEAEKTLPFNENVTSNPYWGSLSFLQAYHGAYAEVLSLSIDFPLKWHYQLMQTVMYNLEGDEKNARALFDSSFQNSPDFANIFLLYTRAECQFNNGLYNEALTSLTKLPALNSNYAGYRAVYYPKSLHLKGKIYEKKGDNNLAVKSYEKFLALWKNADQDLPDLIDAKKRLANLEGIPLR